MAKEQVVFLYVTTSSMEEAEKIGKILLERRLCGCVNIYHGVKSHYWWQGKIESSTEAIMIVKTLDSLVPEVEKTIVENHSYTTPCIAKLDVDIVFRPYLEWLLREVKGEG